MFNNQLFFGFPVDESFQKELAEIPDAIRTLFIDGKEYLQSVEKGGITYLGKSLGECTNLTSLELTQAHIISLLKLLVPKYPFGNQLVLLVIADSC
jgi:hypothetical protein